MDGLKAHLGVTSKMTVKRWERCTLFALHCGPCSNGQDESNPQQTFFQTMGSSLLLFMECDLSCYGCLVFHITEQNIIEWLYCQELVLLSSGGMFSFGFLHMGRCIKTQLRHITSIPHTHLKPTHCLLMHVIAK